MIKGLTMINPHDCLYVKERLTARSDRTGYNAPVMAFDSRRICLMELLRRENSAYLMMQK